MQRQINYLKYQPQWVWWSATHHWMQNATGHRVLKAITIWWSHFQSASYRPLKLCLICRCGLPLMVAIWQKIQQRALCYPSGEFKKWICLPILVAMHKCLPNLVAKFWLPNLVKYQTTELYEFMALGRYISLRVQGPYHVKFQVPQANFAVPVHRDTLQILNSGSHCGKTSHK